MRIKTILSLFVLAFCSTAFASKVMRGANNYWSCTVVDSSDQWTVKSPYQLTAINRAFELCKKQSQNPKRCKASRENCDAYVDGLTTRPMWQCTALDFTAQPFQSSIYRHKDEAALAARSDCKEKSDYPESCYAYLFVCKNLNSRT